MIGIPVELTLGIFRQVQKLIGRHEFELAPAQSLFLDQEYNDNLLQYALACKEWTAIAQSELFKNPLLRDRTQTRRFLELVRGSAMFKEYAVQSTSLKLGLSHVNYKVDGLSGDLDEIALYCPNLVEISCLRLDVRLEYFRKIKKLDKLNLAFGSIEPPSTSGRRIRSFTLPITLLSLVNVTIPAPPLDPSSLPLLRSLHAGFQQSRPIRLLLPQLTSLRPQSSRHGEDLGILIHGSTSITSLSIRECDIPYLDETSRMIIKERIVEFRVLVILDAGIGDITLVAILDRSKSTKKVILDGVYLESDEQVDRRFLESLKLVKEACKKKKIELWKENFDAGNGKVNLEI